MRIGGTSGAWAISRFCLCRSRISNRLRRRIGPTLRDQQLKTLALNNTAMAVTIDIGNPDNVHPTDKVDVGLRLARAARVLSYGEDD